MGWVYGIQSGNFIKVGVADNVAARLSTFRLHNPHPLKVVMRRMVPEAYWVEKRIHQLLAAHAIGREWFECSPELVREAYETAYKALIVERYEQADWEQKSGARAAARTTRIGRPPGTERGMNQTR